MAEWKSSISNLTSINFLNIPRTCLLNDFDCIKVHAFLDTSEKAYGADVYLQIIDIDGKIVRLCFKSKVALLRTIPRL